MVEVEWRRHRADQLREKAKEDAIVIVPVGSLEQHGPHLPVEIDSLLGETVALRTARLAAEKEPVLVLPMLWTGLSEHHMSFGGTITLDTDTFLAVLRCVCESIVRHGFRRIVLLNGHGGNENAMRVAADDLSPKLNVSIVQFTYWYAASQVIAPLLEAERVVARLRGGDLDVHGAASRAGREGPHPPRRGEHDARCGGDRRLGRLSLAQPR